MQGEVDEGRVIVEGKRGGDGGEMGGAESLKRDVTSLKTTK